MYEENGRWNNQKGEWQNRKSRCIYWQPLHYQQKRYKDAEVICQRACAECQIILETNHSIITACCRHYSSTIEGQESQQVLTIKNHSWSKWSKDSRYRWSNVLFCFLQRPLKGFAHKFRRHVSFNEKWASVEYYGWLLKTMFEKTRKYFQLQKRVSLSQVRSWRQDTGLSLVQHA